MYRNNYITNHYDQDYDIHLNERTSTEQGSFYKRHYDYNPPYYGIGQYPYSNYDNSLHINQQFENVKNQLKTDGLLASNKLISKILSYLIKRANDKFFKSVDPLPTPIVSFIDGKETLGVSIPVEFPDFPLLKATINITFTENQAKGDVDAEANVTISVGPVSQQIADIILDYDYDNEILSLDINLEMEVLLAIIGMIPGIGEIVDLIATVGTAGLIELMEVETKLSFDFKKHFGKIEIDLEFIDKMRTLVKMVCKFFAHVKVTEGTARILNIPFSNFRNNNFGINSYNINNYTLPHTSSWWLQNSSPYELSTSNWLTHAWDSVRHTASHVVHNVENNASTIGHAVENTARDVSNDVRHLATDTWHGVTQAAEAVYTGAKDAVGLIEKGIEIAGKAFLQGVEYVGQEIYATVNDAVNDIEKLVNYLGGDFIKIWNFIKSFLSKLTPEKICNFLYQKHSFGPFQFSLEGHQQAIKKAQSQGLPVPPEFIIPKLQASVTSTTPSHGVWAYSANSPSNFTQGVALCRAKGSEIASLNQLNLAINQKGELSKYTCSGWIAGNKIATNNYGAISTKDTINDPSTTTNCVYCYGVKPPKSSNTPEVPWQDLDDPSNKQSFIPDPKKYYHLTTQSNENHNLCLEGTFPFLIMKNGLFFMNECNKDTGQFWKFTPVNDEYYHITNQYYESKDLCLEGDLISYHSGFMNNCSNTSGQLWKIVDAGNGYFKLKTMVQGVDKCLDTNTADTAIFLNDCNNSPGQLWKATAL